MSISGWMADAECLQYDPELFFSGGRELTLIPRDPEEDAP